MYFARSKVVLGRRERPSSFRCHVILNDVKTGLNKDPLHLQHFSNPFGPPIRSHTDRLWREWLESRVTSTVYVNMPTPEHSDIPSSTQTVASFHSGVSTYKGTTPKNVVLRILPDFTSGMLPFLGRIGIRKRWRIRHQKSFPSNAATIHVWSLPTEECVSLISSLKSMH